MRPQGVLVLVLGVAAVLSLVLPPASAITSSEAERQRQAHLISNTRERIRQAKEEIRAAEEMLERGEHPGVWAKLKSLFVTPEPEPEETNPAMELLNTARDNVASAYETVKPYAKQAGQKAAEVANDLYERAKPVANDLYERAKPVARQAGEAAYQKAGEAYEAAKPYARKYGNKAYELAGDAYDAAAEKAGYAGRAAQKKAKPTIDQALHKVKVAIGAEDPTLYERIRGALMPAEPTLAEKIKSALGFGQDDDDDSSDDTESSMLSEDLSSSYDYYKHKLKLALGQAEPTMWERLSATLTPTPSTTAGLLVNKVKSTLGMDGGSVFSRQSILDKVKDQIGSMSPAHQKKLLRNVKVALGLEQPSFTERIKNKIWGEPSFTDQMQDFVGDNFDVEELGHRVKTVIGVEDRSAWEKIKDYFRPSLASRMQDGFEDAASRVRDTASRAKDTFDDENLTSLKRRSLWTRIRDALGEYKPSQGTPQDFMERLRRHFGELKDNANDQAEDLTGSDLEDLAHRIKVAIGAEDRTAWEKVKDFFAVPKPSLASRIKNSITGGDDEMFTVKRRSLFTKVSDALKQYKPVSGGTIEDFMDKIRRNFGELKDNANDQAEDLTGSDLEELAHRVKASIGVEDRSAWEKVKDFFSVPKPSLATRIKDAFSGDDETFTLKRRSLWNKVRDALSEYKPVSGGNVEDFIDKIKRNFGELKDNANDQAEDLTGSDLEELAHRVKASIGVEDRTAWEKVKDFFAMPKPSLASRIKNTFTGGDDDLLTLKRRGLWSKVRDALGEYKPSKGNANDFLAKIRRTFGDLKDNANDQAEDLTGSDLEELSHRVKAAIGMEDKSAWEKVKDAFSVPTPSLASRIKNLVGGSDDAVDNFSIKRRMVWKKVKDMLKDYKPSSGTAQDFLDKVKESFGGSFDMDDEEVNVADLHHIAHKVKVALGIDDPTAWERVKGVFSSEGARGKSRADLWDELKDKLSQKASDVASDVAGSDVVNKAKKAASDVASGNSDEVLNKLKKIFFSKTHKSKIDSAIDYFRDSGEDTRDKAFEFLQRTIHEGRQTINDKLNGIFEKFGEGKHKSKVEQWRQQLLGGSGSGSGSGSSSSGSDSSNDDNNSGEGSYLLQSSKTTPNGLFITYVNDNGREFMDVTGEITKDNFDRLKVLNEFRQLHDLQPHHEIPSNASIQVHNSQRPHVMIKSQREERGLNLHYTYDDGQEELTVEYPDDVKKQVNMDQAQQQRIISQFREAHGVRLAKDAEPPRIRMRVKHAEL